MNTWIDSHLFFFFLSFSSSQGSSPRVVFSFSKFNLKYKTKLQSNFVFEAFSLAEIQYKNLQCCEFMSYYQQCTMGTFLLCSIYMFILHIGQPVNVKTCFIKLFHVGLRDEKKTSYSTFRHHLLQHLGEHSISIELFTSSLTSFHY